MNEPISPGAAKRLSLDEKNILLAQRQRDTALMDQDVESLCQALVTLGEWKEIEKYTEDPRWQQVVKDLNKALTTADDRFCKCPEIEIQVPVGASRESRFIKPHHLSRRLVDPRTGEMTNYWICTNCNFKNLTPVLPEGHLLEARADYKPIGTGSDAAVLRKQNAR